MYSQKTTAASGRNDAAGNAAKTPAENAGAQGKARAPHWRPVTFWVTNPERSVTVFQAYLCGPRVPAGGYCCMVAPKQFIRAMVKGVITDFDSNQEVGVNPSVG